MRPSTFLLAALPATITAQHTAVENTLADAISGPLITSIPQLCRAEGCYWICPEGISTPTGTPPGVDCTKTTWSIENHHFAIKLYCYHTNGARTCESGVPKTMAGYPSETGTVTTAQLAVATGKTTGGAVAVLVNEGAVAAGVVGLLLV